MTAQPGRADRVFLGYIGILVFFGLLALTSASGPMGFAKFGDAYFFVKRQLLFGVIPGIVAFLVLARVDLNWVRRLAWVAYGGTVALLVLSFIPGFSSVINNSHGWLNIFGYSFQPSEVAKLTITILLATLLSQKEHDWSDWKTGLAPIMGAIAPALLLILAEPDVGTASIIVVIVFGMLYIARLPKMYLMVLGAVGAVCFLLLILVAPYRAQRITVFLHPESDPKGIGYQINQAFLAVGSGGFWGLGYGHSRQKFQYLPEVNADSIYAVIAEENGFLISAGLVVLIIFMSVRGLRIAKNAEDEFSCLLVSGIMVWFVWQSFLNIGAMVGALPLTGVPLLFISHGGTAMLSALAGVGLVANVSKTSKLG